MFSIGDTLAEAREKKGQSLKDAEKETKIRAKYLEALEQNKFGLIPGDAYVKIFIREYANFLNIDPNPLISEYKEKHESSPHYEKLGPVNLDAPRKPQRRFLTGFLIVVLLCIGAFFIWQSGVWKNRGEKAVVAEKIKPVDSGSQKKALENMALDKTASEGTNTPPPAAQPPPPQQKFTVRVKTIDGKSSLLKVVVDGQVVFEDHLRFREVKEWSGLSKIVLTIGNPKAVQVEKDGVLVQGISESQVPVVKEFTP